MKNPPNSQMLTIWGFVLVLFGAILYFVSKGQFIFAAMVVGLIPLMTLAREPGKWWLAAVLFANSGLIIPGAGGNITASLAASAGFIGMALLDRIFHRTDSSVTGAPQRFAGFLVLLLICLAAYRGWGLKFLGSSMWGGMQYIQLIVGLLFFFYSRQLKLSEKQLQRTAIICFSLVLLPVVVTLLIQKVRFLSPLTVVFRLGDIGISDAAVGAVESAVGRNKGLGRAAGPMVYLALFLFDRKMRLSWLFMALAGLSFIFAGTSGHRGSFVGPLLTVFFYALVRWKKIPKAVRFKAAIIGTCLLASLYIFARFLPLGYQRTLSVLPGISVDAVAAEDAEGTSNWRVEMWRQMLPMIPDYLLIGRGAGFDLQGAYGAYTLASDRTSMHQFFIATHTYHSGPLWALIDLGGPGALLLIGFMISVIVRYGRRLSWPYSPTIGAAYVVFYVSLLARFVSFLGIYGFHGDIVQMALSAAVLEVISEQATPPATVSVKNQRPAPRRLMPKT